VPVDVAGGGLGLVTGGDLLTEASWPWPDRLGGVKNPRVVVKRA
jgi:hypothetical protein